MSVTQTFKATCLVGLDHEDSSDLVSRVTWTALFTDAETHGRRWLRKQRMRLWWSRGLRNRASVLEDGDGSNRGGMKYGAGSNDGGDHVVRMSAAEFYYHFRFARDHIPLLVKALRIPAFVRTRYRCCLDGEEALLMYLKRLAYPDRLVDLQTFFRRSVGYISEMVEAVRKILHPISKKMLLKDGRAAHQTARVQVRQADPQERNTAEARHSLRRWRLRELLQAVPPG